MRRDWVKVGLLEIICGTGAIILGQVGILNPEAFKDVVMGWGIIFLVIGLVVLAIGLRPQDDSYFCRMCGRRVKKGSMFCSHCSPPKEITR